VNSHRHFNPSQPTYGSLLSLHRSLWFASMDNMVILLRLLN
jgi:hypothetical protein